VSNGVQGAIYHFGYIGEITNNTIYGYQNTPAINCVGPGSYQASQYAANPHQSSVTITGNCIDFKNTFQELDVADIGFFGSANTWAATTAYALGAQVKPTVSNGLYYVCIVAGTSGSTQPTWPTTLNATIVDGTCTWACQTTPSAIQIAGQYDSVVCNNNHIRTDRYLLTDARFNLNPAINLVYVTTSGPNYYPTSATVCGNNIQGWGFHGISASGIYAMTHSGLTVTGNSVGACAGSGITLNATNKAICSGNVINQPGSGSGFPGLQLIGSVGNLIDGVVCTGNSINGGWNVGGNSMTYGILTSYASNIAAQNNAINNAATGTVNTANTGGNHNFSGSTGFFRTAGSSPNGSVTSYWQGEMFFDSVGLHWWAASNFNSTVWTQLSN
jgi:hypothetical protein